MKVTKEEGGRQMIFFILTGLVFVEMIVMWSLYKAIGEEEHIWLLKVFYAFFFAGLVALPIEKLIFHVDSIMWELLVVGIGFIVIGSLVARLQDQKREAYSA